MSCWRWSALVSKLALVLLWHDFCFVLLNKNRHTEYTLPLLLGSWLLVNGFFVALVEEGQKMKEIELLPVVNIYNNNNIPLTIKRMWRNGKENVLPPTIYLSRPQLVRRHEISTTHVHNTYIQRWQSFVVVAVVCSCTKCLKRECWDDEGKGWATGTTNPFIMINY